MALAAIRSERVTTEWDGWSAARPAFLGTHLDSAAAARPSRAVLDAVAAHLLREVKCGAYVAEEEVAGVLGNGRTVLAQLLGMSPDGVAFVENATNALSALLDSWRFTGERTVAIAPSEWGPNLHLFADAGFRMRQLPVDAAGRVDIADLAQQLALDPPALVHLTQVASHRGLIQPVSEVARLCRDAGVPLWVDAAQALGHVDTATGADAVYATSRKWLAGPRGVGVVAVKQSWWPALRYEPRPWAPEAAPVSALESREAHVAGRVGLCVALGEHLAEGPERIRARLAAVGRLTREVFADLPGWEVGRTYGDAGAITALRPLEGQDVVATRLFLLENHGILTTACLPFRAPLEMTYPLLRLSPHIDVTEAELVKAKDALQQLQ